MLIMLKFLCKIFSLFFFFRWWSRFNFADIYLSSIRKIHRIYKRLSESVLWFKLRALKVISLIITDLAARWACHMKPPQSVLCATCSPNWALLMPPVVLALRQKCHLRPLLCDKNATCGPSIVTEMPPAALAECPECHLRQMKSITIIPSEYKWYQRGIWHNYHVAWPQTTQKSHIWTQCIF